MKSTSTQPPFSPSSTGVSGEWLRYLASPFVRDTLGPLLAALATPVPVHSQWQSPPGSNLRAGLTQSGQLNVYGYPDDAIFSHEVGHLIALHLLAPQVTDKVEDIYNAQKPKAFHYQSETGNLPAEYTAETFRMAMELVRNPKTSDKHVSEAEKKFPGTRLWYDWIQKQLAAKSAAPVQEAQKK